MKYEEKLSTKEQEKLREQIRLLSSRVNESMHQQRQRIFGKVATIIEATISDAEQRKSLKDLVSDAIYTPNYWNDSSFQFSKFAEAQGFVLWNELLEPENVYPITPENDYTKL